MLLVCMTRTRKVSRGRVIFTIACLIIFGALVSVADKCTNSTDLEYINPNFVWDWSKDVVINLDAMSISMDETTDLAVVQYIVQEWDSLESIATEFWTTVSNLKKINGISSIKIWQKIVVTNEEDGILYKVRENQNIKVFANKYWLNLQDLMTMNYITDDSEILYKGQEIFINLSEEKANTIPWFIDKAQPDLSTIVVKPKTTTTTKTTTTKTTWWSKPTWWSTTSTTTTNTSSSKILSKRTYNANISNGFYRGYCTWYVATQVPSIFPYTSETTQDRPFGWDAIRWYDNAKAAWYTVSKTPRSSSIIVYKKLRSAAWHVWIVKQYPYNWDSTKMLVEDMNYAWKFVVTQRIESVNRAEIIWYIYY